MGTAYPSRAEPQYVTGNDLYRWCSAKKATSLGYVLGVFDSIMLRSALGHADREICTNEDVEAGQLVDVVCASLEAKPSTRHISASIFAEGALKAAFPCLEGVSR